MPQILLQPGNPLDPSPEDLEDLAQAIRKLDPNFDVQFAYKDQIGHRVTFWEVVSIWLPQIFLGIAVEQFLELAVDWALLRFKEEKEAQIEQLPQSLDSEPQIQWRPKYIEILGPDGQVLKAVRIKSPGEEPEDVTIDEAKKPPRRRPPIR